MLKDVTVDIAAYLQHYNLTVIYSFLKFIIDGVFPKGEARQRFKRRYDKISYCTFCFKEVKSKISRHLMLCHSDNEKVKEIRFLPKKSKERAILLQILANEGNFKHNSKVMKSGKGFLVVARRQLIDQKNEVHSYLPCEFCYNFFVKRRLWHHVQQCKVRMYYKIPDSQKHSEDDDVSRGCQSNYVRRGRSLLDSATLENDSDILFAKLIERMADGEIRNVVLQDEIIKRFAVLRMECLGNSDDQKQHDIYGVSQGARTLARLVIEVCKTIKSCTLDVLLNADNFDAVVKATKCLCESSGSLSLGIRIGHLLGHAVLVKIGLGLRTNVNVKCQEAEDVKKLFDLEWTKRVSSLIGRRLARKNLSKKTVIPSTQDLVKWRNYLVERIQVLTTKLGDKQCIKLEPLWLELNKVTLCRLILFNKRRVAEITNLQVDTYISCPSWTDQNDEFDLTLSITEKRMAKR